jgi:regulator of replication initiation timing
MCDCTRSVARFVAEENMNLRVQVQELESRIGQLKNENKIMKIMKAQLKCRNRRDALVMIVFLLLCLYSLM